MTVRIGLATANLGKVREIRSILAPAGVEIIPPPPEWIAPEETGTTYLDNATLKARSLAQLTGESALADDSGIEVDALGGKPGVHSARFAGPGATDQDNLSLLIAKIAEVPAESRTARYRCVAVLVRPAGARAMSEGTVEGTLITQPRGTGGFGYDPIFVPAGEQRTMAELTPGQKDEISHRGAAFRGLLPVLASLGQQ